MPDSSQLGALTLAVEIKYCDSEACHICSVILRILFFRIIFGGGKRGGGRGILVHIPTVYLGGTEGPPSWLKLFLPSILFLIY